MGPVDEKLELIKDQLVEGNFSAATRSIGQWLKRHSPNAYERIRLSEYYTWMGREDLSWKILGPPKTKWEMSHLAVGELCVQMRLAYCVGMLGSRYLAYRLIQGVQEELSEQKISLQWHYPQFYQNYGYLHISSYDYEKARWGFENALELYPPSSYQWFYISLGLSDCDSGQGRFNEAINRALDLVSSSTSELLKATALQALGEYLTVSGQIKAGSDILLQSKAHFQKDPSALETKDYAYLLKHLGLNALLQDQLEQAKDYLLEARNFFLRADQTPNSLMEVTFWLEVLGHQEVSLQDQVTLRCYPHYSLYAQLIGRKRGAKDATPIPEWLQPFQRSSSGDVWLISDGKIVEKNYREIEDHLLQCSLDLYACVFQQHDQLHLLTSLQSSLLMSLIGGGTRGVHEYLLLDRSYRQDFVEYQSGLDRLKKAVLELKKKGFRIRKNKMTYFWDEVDTALTVIIPKDLIGREYYPRAQRHFPHGFETQDLVELFQSHPRTIQRWLLRWREKGHLVADKKPYAWSSKELLEGDEA